MNRHYNKRHSLLIAGLLCLALFVVLLIMVYLQSPYLSINNYILILSEEIQNNYIHLFSAVVSLLGNKYIIIPTFVLSGIILYLKNQKWLSLHLTGSILIAAILAYVFKSTIAYPRPEINVLATSYAFPSRHVALCATYVTFLAALIITKSKHSWLVITTSSLIILLESFARIALQIHWLIDVIGGALLGISCGLLGAYSFFRRPQTKIYIKTLLATLLVIFLILSLVTSIFGLM